MSKPSVLAEPVFVGREAELHELQSFLNSAIEGKGKTVFVSGDAGSGKTRLTREFLNSAIRQGIAVMAGWCLSDSQAPFFPFIEAFNSYYYANPSDEQSNILRQPQLNLEAPPQIVIEEREVASWLAGPKTATQAGRANLLSPQVWKDQALAAVAKTIHAIAAETPLILFIEDLHWADSASLALLHYLSTSIKDSDRVLLLATYRSEELRTDAEGHPHPLVETLRKMRREELFSEIKISSLDKASISKLAQSMLGAYLQPEFTDKLAAKSEGSPLFIVESLRMFHQRGDLIKEGNCWRTGLEDVSIPSKIKDIILSRVCSLKREERRALDAASVIGEEFNTELLASVISKDSLTVLETLGSIAESTSLIVCEADSFRFDHAKSREALYEAIPFPLKKGYHVRIAESLERSSKCGALPLSDLAYHYAQAGSTDKAVKFALASAKDELTRWSNIEAIKHFRYVIQAIGENQGYIKEKEAALEGLGDAFHRNLMFKEAVKAFEQLADSTQDNNLKFRALIKAITFPAFALGDAHTMKELIKKAEPYAAGDRWKNARLILERGRANMIEGVNFIWLKDFEESFQVFAEECPFKWQTRQEQDDYPAIWLALLGMELNHPRVGKFREAIAESLLSVVWAEEIGEIYFLQYGYEYAGNVFNICFLPDQALILCAKAKEIHQRTKIGHTFFADIFSAWAFMQKGDFPAALSNALAAVEITKKSDSNRNKAIAYSTLARINALLGNAEGSNEFFAKLIELGPKFLSDPYVLGELTKAVHLAVNGQWNESNKAFEELLANRQKLFGHTWWMGLIHMMYGWSLNVQGRLEEASFHSRKIQEFGNEIKQNFDHSFLQMNLMVCRKVEVASEFEMRLDIINASSKAAQKVYVEGLIFPNSFVVEGSPAWIMAQKAKINVDDKVIDPFSVETVKLKLKAKEATTLSLKLAVVYLDDLGNRQRFEIDPVTIVAEQAKPDYEALPGRISTGYGELDRLLIGGIPEGYAVVLVSPSFEERQKLIENYVEAGLKHSQTTFYLTAEPRKAKALAAEYPSTMFLFVCNPRADVMIKDLSNVFKLKGVDNLTEIDIVLTKASRQLGDSSKQKRAIIEIVSDVLLQHHAVTTRKWLSGLIQDLKSKGFTILAIIDPSMHPSEEVNATLGLFDGEIRISQEKSAGGQLMKKLQVLRLQSQNYSKDEVTLN